MSWRKSVKKHFKLNHQITAGSVRVIDEEGKQIGVLSLSQALTKAQNAQKDLVEIAPDANPPVAKIVDFKKFKYLEERKEKEAKKHIKETELKEVRFSPFIGEHDLQTRLNRARKFLEEGNLVKITIVFKGRQMTHTEFGPKLLEKIMSTFSEIAEKDRPETMMGRRLITIIKPIKKQKKGKDELENEVKNQKSSS